MALAAQQHGLVTRAQLLDLGMSRHRVEGRVRSRLLRPLHAGVYQVGPVAALRAREMAAVLACPEAVISHRAAAALRRMLPPRAAPEPTDVTVPPTCRCGRRPGIRVHRSTLPPEQIDFIDGIPVTSAARTLLDIGTRVTARELEQALAFALREDLVRWRDIHALVERAAGRAGARPLRLLLARETGPAFTRSEAEERLLALVRRSGLPEPELNVSLHGMEVDCYWRASRLVVEVDGFAFHASSRAFVRDRKRDAALAAAGIQVLRLGWQQLEREPERTLVQLALALARSQR